MKYFKILLILLFTVQLKAASAQVKSDTLKLDLQQAEKMFLDKNLSLLAAKYNVSANEALIRQARKWDNPVLLLDENLYDHNQKKWFNVGSNGQSYAQVQQLIKLGGKRKATVDIAKDNLEIAKLQLDDLLRNLRLTLHSDLYNAEQFIQTGNLYKDEVSELQKLADALQKQVRVGNTALKELLRVQGELYNMKNDQLQNQNQLIDVQAELRQLLMLPENTFVLPIVSDSINANVAQLNGGDLFNTAKENRSDFKIQMMQTTLQQHNLNLQRAGEVPDLTVGTEYDHNSNFITDYWGLTLAMPLPILNTNRQNVKAAKNFVAQAQEQTTLMEKTVATDVNSALQKLNSTLALNTSLKNTLGKRYDEMFENMMKNYQQRNLSLLELMDFFDTYKDAKLNQLQLINNAHNAVEELNYSVGKTVINQ